MLREHREVDEVRDALYEDVAVADEQALHHVVAEGSLERKQRVRVRDDASVVDCDRALLWPLVLSDPRMVERGGADHERRVRGVEHLSALGELAFDRAK